MNVSDLEAALFARFPRENAEAWDHVGLSVGDPQAPVHRVAGGLDASLDTVRRAHELGADVLLTHHPVYISAPPAFTPLDAARAASGAVVYEAVRRGVSIISMHTNLDRSHEARSALPELMGLTASSSLEYPNDPECCGLGALCSCPETDLATFAACAAEAFSTEPRVWGDPSASVKCVAFLGGSLGDFGERALAAGADAIACGECGYHVAQDLCARGLSVILLGHDRSEEAFTRILASAAQSAGMPSDTVTILPGPRQWWTAR